MARSLREFVQSLRNSGKLLVITKEVEPKFELNAVVRKIQSGQNLPVLFERVRGCRYPVISNTLGNYATIGKVLGVDQSEVAARWAALARATDVPADAESEQKLELEEISLADIPHITFSEKDAGPYLTAGIIIARDPDSGILNLSYHRMQIVSDTELRCRLSTSGDLFRIQQFQETRGEPLKATVVIGVPPSVMLAGATTVGPFTSEYDLASRLSGFRIATAASPMHGHLIPPSTEFVIEGEILAGIRRREGPFGEWMDYYVPPTDNHVFAIQRVYARKNALFYAISAGSLEELAMSGVPIAGTIFDAVRKWVPNVADVVCFPLLQFCAIRLAKPVEGQAQRAIMATFGAEMNRVLYCIVVDEDVNIHNWNDVMWAMATRCRPDRDIFQVPNVPSFSRDPHRIHWGRVGVVATKPAEHAADFERKSVPGLETLRLEDYLQPGPSRPV